MLSHDSKEIIAKITDKTDKGGLRTKTVKMLGYPTVFFCTATGNVDLQELTRFVVISPEISKVKITAGIRMSIAKNSDLTKYNATYEGDEQRTLLIERVVSIKQERIDDVILEDQEKISELFTKSHPNIQPRHQRDVTRLIGFIKAFTLLNLWWRKRQGKTIFANDSDVANGFAVWEYISTGSDFNLPPYVYEVFTKVIKPLIESKEVDTFTGSRCVSRAEVLRKYHQVNGISLSEAKLRVDILPALEDEGLIEEEKSFSDGRKVLIKLAVDNAEDEPQNDARVILPVGSADSVLFSDN